MCFNHNLLTILIKVSFIPISTIIENKYPALEVMAKYSSIEISRDKGYSTTLILTNSRSSIEKLKTSQKSNKTNVFWKIWNNLKGIIRNKK